MSVRAFTPVDSLVVTETLLKMGEERVNLLNRRSYRDSLATATRQLAESENALRRVQVSMTSYRDRGSDIDPEGSSRAQLSLVTTLTASLTQAKAQLQAMRGVISPSSPQYAALAARVRALDAQVAAQRGRLTGGSSAIASNLGGYEDLRIRQEFAAKRYEATAAAYQLARQEAQKKQLYVVTVVNPNLAVKALYPERLRIIATIFFSLLIAYGVIWFMQAGVRENVNT